jgi:VCBS repeat-containing protein
VTVTVTGVNDPTIVTGGTSGTGNEDTTLTGTLTATDVEGVSDGTVFTVSTAATNGTASIDPATGLWSYTPNADYNGADSFTVTITDDAGNTATQVISVTVTPVVDITNDSLTTNEDSAISANVLTGSNGATADSFEGTPVLTSVTQGANGTVTFLANGTVTYTPNANFNGTDSFTYTITSGGVPETATVTVTVTGVNDPTIVTGGTSGTGNEDTTLTGTLTATDVEGLSDGTVFTVSTNGTQGTASIDPATGLWSYTPTADWNGSDSFTVTLTDDAGNTATQVITLTVTAVNDAPVVSANTGSTVAEGGTDTIDSSELAVTDVDNTAAQLTYTIGIGPAYGRLELTTAPGLSATTFTQADIAANRLVYVHNGSETTSDSFTFTVSDGAGGTLGTTTMTLTITPVNDTPTITSDGGASTAGINVAENVSAVTIVTGADVDLPAQALTYNISGGADQALFTINTATGALSFTAPPDFEAATDANGDNVYVVQVQVTDSQGASTTQTIQVTVADVVEGVLPTPTPPPVLLSTAPPRPTGPGPVPSNPSGPAESSTDALPQAPVLPDSRSAPVESHSATVLPSPTERLVVIRPEEPRETIDAVKDSVLFPWIDEARRLLLSGISEEATPTPESEPAEKSQSVSDLLFSKLDEMTASLEQAMGVSQEQHAITVRIAALTGTTLSAGFIAWALRSGTLLASFMATMPAWRHFDPLPVLGGSRSELERRRKKAEQDRQAENAEFKGLKYLLDLGLPPDPKP